MNKSEIAEVVREIRRHFDEDFDTTIAGAVFDRELLQIVERAIAESQAPQPQSNTQGEVYNYYVCEGCGSQVNGSELPEGWCEFGQSALREVGRKFRRIPLAAWCPECQRNGKMNSPKGNENA